MAIKQKNVHKNWTAPGYRLPGVAATEAAYLLLENRSTADRNEGDLWYDTTNNVLKTYDGSGWSVAGLNSQSAGSLNDAASIGGTITVDGSTITNDFAVTVSSGGGDVAATFTQNDTTGNGVDVVLINTGSGVTLDFTSSGTYDIQGSGDYWDITAVGHADFVAGIGIDADSQALTFGESDDVSVQFVDGWSGSAGSGLLIASSQSTDQIQFGDATYAFDIRTFGSTNTSIMLWDASADALIFDECDIQMGDADIVAFGDSQDFTLSHTGTTPEKLTLAGANGQFDIGVSGASMDVYWHTENTGQHVFFDEDNAVVDFVHVDIMVNDDADIYFGSGDDWAFGGTTALVLLAAQDNQTFTVGNSGGTIGSDLLWYTGTAAAGFFIDSSADKVYLDKADLHLGDDDYLILGDQGTAGSSKDATVRWDASGGVLEIYGATKFDAGDVTVDDNCIIAGNLSVGGTLTLTGAFSTGDVSMGDSETLSFGNSDDITMMWNGSTNALVIEGATQGTSIEIGYANSQDVNFYGDTATNFMKYDGTANTLTFDGTDILMLSDDLIRFGTLGEFWMKYDDASTDNLIISSSTANDAVQIGDGTTGTDLKLMNTINASAFILWDDSAETWFFGQDNHGVIVRFCGDNAYDCVWDETADTLYFEDSAALGIGASSGTPDLEFISASTTTAMILNQDLVIYGDGKDIFLGASGAHGSDLYIKSATADNYIKWDAGTEHWSFGTTGGAGTDVTFQSSVKLANKATWDASAGEMQFGNDAILSLGNATNATADIKIYSDATTVAVDLAMNMVISGDGFNIQLGSSGSNGSDVIFQGTSDANDVVYWNAGDQLWTFGSTHTDSVDVIFEGSVLGTTITWNGGAETWAWDDQVSTYTWDLNFESGSTNALRLKANDAATSQFILGTTGTNGMDVVFQSASSTQAVTWTAGAACSWQFGATGANGTDVIFSAASGSNDHVTWDAGEGSWTFGGTGTNSIDVIFQSAATTANRITWDGGADTWIFGSTHGNSIDVTFEGSALGTTCKWDGGAETWAWDDQVSTYTWDLNFSAQTSNALRLKANDAATSEITFGTTGTNGLDVIFQAADTNSNKVSWIAGANASWTFGGTGGNGVDVHFQSANVNANKCTFDAGADTFIFGSTQGNSVDVKFESSYTTASVAWDAGAGSLVTEPGTSVQFQGNVTTAAYSKGLGIPTVAAAPTTTTTTIPTKVALICYQPLGDTSGTLWVRGGTSHGWVAAGCT